MAKYNTTPSQGPQSVKFRAKPLTGPSFEIADFSDGIDVHILFEDKKHARKKSTSESSELLSTPELISAVGHVWDHASRSLARFQPSDASCLENDEPCYLVGSGYVGIVDLIDSRYLHVDLKSPIYFPCMVRQSLECMRLTQNMPYVLCDESLIWKLFWRNWHGSFLRDEICSKEKSLANIGILYSVMGRYGWMNQISPRQALPISSSVGDKKTSESFTSEVEVGNEHSLSSNSGALPDLKNPSLVRSAKVAMNCASSISSLYSDYYLHPIEDTHNAASMSTTSSSGLHMDYHVSNSALGRTSEPISHKIEDDNLLDHKMRQCEKLNTQGEIQSDCCPSVIIKPHPLLAKQEHAMSGALAGIFVSLCLHPIDTIKTVVQSCRAGQKNVCYIGQSIISERGLSGLYRGITSNISTSAPISAIYAFTYESVKGFLLPSLAKEYHSVAHCTAGACASIATSFIFTPSERIKQQMQVNTQYQNSWNAVIRIIEKGGLPSLYAGWGAVLCRNIPHSIIKFYTYESLKQVLMSSEQPNKQPNTLQTLLCGGVAGSTAALFSTPFDVVKTRLQTQMPGSVRRYHSIFNALQEICEHEGVKGLYRGLIPRLVMYMSQGALFFGSYEFFKCVISSELRPRKPEML